MFKSFDDSFTSISECDMTSSAATTCSMHVSVLRGAPLSLDWGASIVVKLYATNDYGNSAVSNEGNGAIITTTPDAPINLAEVYEQRTKSTIGLAW